ncbi:MAG: 16S rRNA (guanine(527)-N(7))-methyltransferase RsmG, partial [Burkholderiales bacterium]
EYVALIDKWNQVHNLTAIRGRANMITQHLLDSLAIQPFVVGRRRLLDVGTGAGLPGIPLAIANPELAVTLLDSSRKKVAFLQQAVGLLRLTNVATTADRVEDFRASAPFEVIVSRAFADLAEFVALSAHLLAPGGRFLAMKGLHPYDEIERLPAEFSVSAVHPLHVPGLKADRHLIVIQKGGHA